MRELCQLGLQDHFQNHIKAINVHLYQGQFLLKELILATPAITMPLLQVVQPLTIVMEQVMVLPLTPILFPRFNPLQQWLHSQAMPLDGTVAMDTPVMLLLKLQEHPHFFLVLAHLHMEVHPMELCLLDLNPETFLLHLILADMPILVPGTTDF